MNPTINLYYVYVDRENNLGHIESIVFPDRDAVHFNEETGTIDLSALADYKDFPLNYHCDGEIRKAYIGEVGPRKIAQPDGELKEVMAVELTWEETDGEEE